MQLVRMCMIASTGMMALVAPARSDDAPKAAANQVAGLFTQSCIQFAGDTESLRGWADRTGLKALPAEAQNVLPPRPAGYRVRRLQQAGQIRVDLRGRRLLLGRCPIASGPVAIADLEHDMNDARIAFKVTGEETDPEEKSLTHREYLASQGQREWLLLVSTVKDPPAGQAMLTANRN